MVKIPITVLVSWNRSRKKNYQLISYRIFRNLLNHSKRSCCFCIKSSLLKFFWTNPNWTTPNWTSPIWTWSTPMPVFLASQDALEVMLFTYSLTPWWLAMTWLMWPWWVMIPKEDLTGVILVSEDGFWRLDWCDSGYWGGFLETWLMWLWLLRRPFRDLIDVTLVSDDMLRRLDWCDSGVEDAI